MFDDPILAVLLLSIAAIAVLWPLYRSRWQGAGRLAYMRQSSQQTLREGLDEYYASDPDLLPAGDVSEEIRGALLAHDAAHVVFGCDTSSRGEILLTRWSLFGASDAMPIYLKGLRSRETRFLFVDFFKKLNLLTLPFVAVEAIRAFACSLRMPARWPSYDYERYLDRRLVQIRNEFNIHVV